MNQDIEKIYNMYFKDVFRYLMRLSGGNTSLAEEITQETFFKALQNIDSFRNESSMFSWLCQIAKNTYINSVRKESRIVYDAYIEEIPSNEDIQKSARIHEQATNVKKAIELLDEPYKSVIQARIVDELSFSEISEKYQKSESWARVTYHRARALVKERLK